MCVFFFIKRQIDKIELEYRVLELEGQIKINIYIYIYIYYIVLNKFTLDMQLIVKKNGNNWLILAILYSLIS